MMRARDVRATLGFRPQDDSIMEFEDNWAYPWPTIMYDPVLKIILRPSHGREPEPHDTSFSACYDPGMIPGYYSRPKTTEERERDLRYESSARFADNPIPVQSPSARNIFDGSPRTFVAQAGLRGDALRLKFMKQYQSAVKTRGELYWANGYLEGIAKSNVPIISARPREFLIHVLKSYIHLPDLPEDADFPRDSCPHLRRIELCVSPAIMTKILKLDPADHVQVEPDWYCLASRELNP